MIEEYITILLTNVIPSIIFGYLAMYFEQWWLCLFSIIFIRACSKTTYIYTPFSEDLENNDENSSIKK